MLAALSGKSDAQSNFSLETQGPHYKHLVLITSTWVSLQAPGSVRAALQLCPPGLLEQGSQFLSGHLLVSCEIDSLGWVSIF